MNKGQGREGRNLRKAERGVLVAYERERARVWVWQRMMRGVDKRKKP